MKKSVLLFSCVLFILISNLPLLSQTWTLQSTQSVIIKGIAFLDATTAIAVGGNAWASRLILRTTNTGTDWTAISTSASAYAFTAVFFTSNGYAFGNVGTIIKTIDGGVSWSFLSNPASSEYQNLSGGSFYGSTGIAVGQYGVIVYSTDDGGNWSYPTTYPSYNVDVDVYGYGQDLSSVSFSSSDHAVAVGINGYIYKTTNSGKDWVKITTGGVNVTTNYLIAIHFFNGNTGVAVGSNGEIIRTTDGGATWSAPTSKPNIGTAAWRAISFVSTTTGIVVGDAGNMAKTVDGGQNWTIMTNTFSDGVTNTTFTGVAFRDIDNGFAVGINASYQGKIYHTTNAALPVELTSFTASIKNSAVELKWNTATEVNNYGFEILRSAQNDNWVKIGFVNGHGNSNSPKNYSFTDMPLGGTKFQYRLKQIDFDGQFEYSDVVDIQLETPVNFVLNQNYPNPFNPITIISFSLPTESRVNITVFNMLGQEVKTLVDEVLPAGYQTVKCDASNLASGTYIYRVKAGEFVQFKKLVLIK